MAAEPGKVIMIVNEFENSKEYRLQQIMHTLESVHGVKLDFDSSSEDEIRTLGESCEIIKNSIVHEGAFNTAMQNPEYTKNMLIMEAVKIYLAEIAPKRMSKKKKAVKEGLDPDNMVKLANFGRKMMDYAQNARSTDDKELRILNAISQVGDKLTQVGTPFGPTTLTDIDKKVIEVARRRMSAQKVAETVPGQEVKLQPGMLKVKKDGSNQEEVIDAKDLANKQKQGFQPVAEDDELGMLYKKYGIDEATDQDHDGDNDFADVMIARMMKSGMSREDAIAKTKDKSYNKESMMEAKKPDLEALKKKKAELEDKMDKIVKDGGKMSKTDPLHKQYDKVCDDIKAAKKSLKESAHMENHDDYQASMARSELYRNTKYAMDMMKMIGPDDSVVPWIATNLTKAAEILDKVFHYMDYHITFEKPEPSSDLAAGPVTVDEEADMIPGDDGSIARQNLMMIMEYSTKLFRMIHPGDKLEGWVAMKLTVASEAVSSSKHHLDYVQFEKHAGDMMGEMPEMPAEPVAEGKKKAIKEGKMVTIGNLLMTMMLNEEQDLAQAETLLAAKSMSDDLQGIAEKLAKMGVDDLMPLVDTMKEQFGQEAANGFNETVKAVIDAALASITDAKDTADNAILSMQQGQVPGVASDLATADLAAPAGDEEDMGDDFGATPAAAGDEEEPLGRAKKDEEPADLAEGRMPASVIKHKQKIDNMSNAEKKEYFSGKSVEQLKSMAYRHGHGKDSTVYSKFHDGKTGVDKVDEAWDAKMKTAEKDKGKWEGYTVAELKAKKKKLMDKESRTAAEQKEVKQINFALRAKSGWGKVAEGKDKEVNKAKKKEVVPPKSRAKDVKSAFDPRTDLKPVKKVSETAKPDFPDIDGDKDTKEPIKKAAADKKKADAKKVDEGNKMKQNYIDAAAEKLPGLKKAGWKKDMTPKAGKKAEDARKTADKRIAGMTKAAMTMKEATDEPKTWRVWGEYGPTAHDKVEYKIKAATKEEAKKKGIEKLKKTIHWDRIGVSNVYVNNSPIKESKINEVAPPGKKAEDFIRKNKASFKDRYGKRWEEVLYATAWKKFGPKSESYVKAEAMLESVQDKRKTLVKAFDAHKAKYARMVSEGTAADPLKAGYGLEGQTLLDQISDTDSMIAKLKEMIRTEVKAGMQ